MEDTLSNHVTDVRLENSQSLSENPKRKGFCGKYGEAIKTCLLPFRCAKRKNNVLPNSKLGLFSFVSLAWMDSIMWKASRHGLEVESMKTIGHQDGVHENSQRLSRLWNEEVKKKGLKKASLMRVIWRFNRTRLIIAALMMVFTCVLQYVGPAWIFKYFLDFMDDQSLPMSYGAILIALLALTMFLRNICYNTVYAIGAPSGVRVQGALQMLVFNKILTSRMTGEKLLAEVVNHCTTDIERIFQCIQLATLITGSPVMWVMNVVYCYMIIGPWSIGGNVIVLLYFPLLVIIANKISRYRVQCVKLSDTRIGLLSQMLTNIKLIKIYAWEDAFSQRVQAIRHKEENILKKGAFLSSINFTATAVVAVVGPMVGFFGLVLYGGKLTTSMAFTMISVFSSLQLPMGTLPIAVKSLSEGIVSCGRIQRLLAIADSIPPSRDKINDSSEAIIIRDCSLAWPDIGQHQTTKIDDKTEKHSRNKKVASSKKSESQKTLNISSETIGSAIGSIADDVIDLVTAAENINLTVKKGTLVGICGNVGSGKSTLLAGISGEVMVRKGSVSVFGEIALASQQGWIFNATLRDNILFGLEYDEAKYNTVVEACCLTSDFNLMPNGDLTEIGERGANLSGGQKQRVNLARSLYSDRNIYLLDDVLSAVDVKVANHIFNSCIKKVMHGKTVLLVTHAIHFLKQCDYILLMKNGSISERGIHDELLSENGDYAKMFLADKARTNAQSDKGVSNEANIENEENVIPDEGPMVDQGLIKEETDASRKITWRTFLYYTKACGGYCVVIWTFMIVVLFNAASLFNSIWLQTWMDAGEGNSINGTSNSTGGGGLNASDFSSSAPNVEKNPDLHMYLVVYGASAILIVIIGIFKAMTFGKVMVNGAIRLHYDMFCKIVRSPLGFFDANPMARIINRFSRDIDELDTQIPSQMEYVTQILMLILFQIVLVGVLFPVYFIIIGIIIVIYTMMDNYLSGGVRATKRMDNLLRPPILVHISTTIQGLNIIRCFQKQKMFIERFANLVNKHLAAFLIFQLSSKWLSFRIDTLAWFAVISTAIMILLMKGTASAAVAGLALSQILRVCTVLAVITRWKSELQARLISIERIAHYCKNLAEEAPACVTDTKIPDNWPTKGAVTFTNVDLRYREDLPLVLHQFSAQINGGEKIGIIGRTGAGKSSVIGTLLRLTEISGGTIEIDNLNIAKIGLKDLRSKIAVIPQEPVLFEGTIRWNLDPFNIYSDEAIWTALEKAHLKQKVLHETLQLDSHLTAEGGGFSVGEKQLFCLARALLRNSKILLMDEATASVDVETDIIIQHTIRESFSDCTVLTIAHRLNTIMDYNRILTMDAGKVVEFDSPKNLLEQDSTFRAMINAMGTMSQ